MGLRSSGRLSQPSLIEERTEGYSKERKEEGELTRRSP